MRVRVGLEGWMMVVVWWVVGVKGFEIEWIG